MELMTVSKIESMIYVIRTQKVMLDSDLATLYDIETKVLNRAVKRNIERFPEDFMFQLTDPEMESLRCQFGTSKDGRGGRRYNPFVFTENGVAMLSSVLNSERAINVNISIMRIFTKLRSFLFFEKGFVERLEKVEEGTHKMFKLVFERMDSIEEIIMPPMPTHRRKVGLRKENL